MSKNIDLVRYPQQNTFGAYNPQQNAIEEDDGVKVIEAHSRANAVKWGFILLAASIGVLMTLYVALDIAKLETATLREWLQTTIASEVGLLAGLLGARDRN